MIVNKAALIVVAERCDEILDIENGAEVSTADIVSLIGDLAIALSEEPKQQKMKEENDKNTTN